MLSEFSMKVFLFILSLFIFQSGYSQDEHAEIKSVINRFFEGMKSADSAMVRKTMTDNPVLMTTFTRKGIPQLQSEELDGLLKAIATPGKPGEVYDERLLSWKILVDDRMASVWTPYAFYIGDNFSHCGVNSFHMYKSADGWKIAGIFDTRRKENCP